MNSKDPQVELLTFFKALADENRLKIVGLLAQHAYSVEDLASALGLSVSATSHHLSKLARAGLVSARTEGHYYYYSLQTDQLHAMAQRLLQEETLPKPPREETQDAFERKVLASFTDDEGRVKAFPHQEKKFLVILRYVVRAFEPGVEYPEKQVNEILSRFNEDTATLRRNLVAYKLMNRQGGGGSYWRIDQKEKTDPV